MIKRLIAKHLKPIYAHCDIPCGYYETDTLQHNAHTCRILIEKLCKLEKDEHQRVRLILVKEEHAKICKQQIYILWSDFFKTDHFEKYPQLAKQLHRMAGLCSQIKQSADLQAVKELEKEIQSLKVIFQEVKCC